MGGRKFVNKNPPAVNVQTPFEPLERPTAVSCSKAPSFVAKFNIRCQSEAVVQNEQK